MRNALLSASALAATLAAPAAQSQTAPTSANAIEEIVVTAQRREESVQDVPDFATHIRYEGDRGHVQLSTLARAIGYRPFGGELTRRGGGGCEGEQRRHGEEAGGSVRVTSFRWRGL